MSECGPRNQSRSEPGKRGYVQNSLKDERLACRSRSEFLGRLQKKDLKLFPPLSDSEVDQLSVVRFCTINSVTWNSNQRLKLVMKETIWNENISEEEVCLDQIEESSFQERSNDCRRREPSARGDFKGSSAVENRQPTVTITSNRLARTTSSSFWRGEWDP